MPARSTVTISVPPREGASPATSRPSADQPFPHQQLDQNARPAMQEALFQRVIELAGITVGRSLVVWGIVRESYRYATGAGSVGRDGDQRS